MTTDPSSRAEQRRWRVRVQFKREDCWVGVFWRTERTTRGLLTTWWVCLLPMLPIVVQHATDQRWRALDRDGSKMPHEFTAYADEPCSDDEDGYLDHSGCATSADAVHAADADPAQRPLGPK